MFEISGTTDQRVHGKVINRFKLELSRFQNHASQVYQGLPEMVVAKCLELSLIIFAV